ncbi:MAG: chemotaxis protein CheW [Pirellulales bacterium]
MSETRQYCTFLLDGQYFGVDVREVQEVIRYQEMTRVPLASDVVSGLINLRGRIVTAIDLRRRLGHPDRPAGKLPMNVVVHTGEDAVSLLVDEIGDVIEVEVDKFETPPDTLQGVARTLVNGAYKLDDRLMLVLHIRNAVEVANNDMMSLSA